MLHDFDDMIRSYGLDRVGDQYHCHLWEFGT